nr:hypothetical protein [uncultured Rhodoferax sp.]
MLTIQQNTSLGAPPQNARNSSLLFWAPCIATLLYLSGSLLIFKCGPVEWPIHNEGDFWTLNALYLIMFLVGYGAAMWKRHWWGGYGSTLSSRGLTERFFWPIWGCALLVVLIGHRNLTAGRSYIPTTLIFEIISGLTDPHRAYDYKLSEEAKGNFSGNPPITLLYGALAFSKLLLVYMLVSSWSNLSLLKKFLGVGVALFPVVSGVCVGTNKPVFDVAFVFSTLFLAQVSMTPRAERPAFIKARRVPILLAVCAIVFAGWYFKHSMNARAPGLGLAAGQSTSAGVVRLRPGFQDYCESNGEWTAKGCSFVAVGVIYLTQGYYGMSISTGFPLETTYGLGHSRFMTDALQKYLGIDLKPRTYQQRIRGQWGANGGWHSAYSEWANDVGFVGVALVMLALGFYVSAIWISALVTHNVAAVCSLPLLVILIFFIPANNQVFNLLESLASFVVLFIVWVASLVRGKRVGAIGRAS